MTRRLYIILMAILIIATACSDNNVHNGTHIIGSQLPNLHAEFAEDTRTYIEEGNHLRWHEGDLITVFYGNTLNQKYIFDGQTGDNSGTFSHIVDGSLGTGNPLNHIYAIYPYNKRIKIDDIDQEITITIPDTQPYETNSFGKGANIMIAKTANTSIRFLSFKNCCGYIKLQLYGPTTVSRIELRGNNNETLTGVASIYVAEDGIPHMNVVNGESTITITCDRGIELNSSAESPTEFWFTVPPTTFKSGISVTIYDTNGNSYTQSTTNEIDIVRNTIQPMRSLEVVMNTPTPTDFAEMEGTWHLTQWRNTTPPFDVYMDIDTQGNIVLYQRIDSRQWEIYDSTATMDGDIIRGTYSDGVAWGASYSVTMSGDTMTWIDTAHPTDKSVYTRSELPSYVKSADTRTTSNSLRFL